jgi:maltooligosyltrehalose trehalohydrolase
MVRPAVYNLVTDHQEHRRLPAGAEVVPGGVHFRVWAPEHKKIEILIEGKGHDLEREKSGYWSGFVTGAAVGTRYSYRIKGEGHYPDPASRYQPEGPHKASAVVDPDFAWTDSGWTGLAPTGQVIYELHIGTFTPEGTWAAAAAKLPYLASTGITVVEVMPVNEFPGTFGWGYDGVHPFAPTRLYGEPDDFRRFVDQAHANRIGVILDVVYNHLGPDGNYLAQFSPYYFTDRHKTDWGAAINFECTPVRDFFISNAAYWIREFHCDGLRFDATQNIYDDTPDHILAAMVRECRKTAAGKSLYFVGENEPQHTVLVKAPEAGGYGINSLWNDDYHHTAMVALSGHSDAYYTDYKGTPQEFVSAMKYGYLFQGQWYKWQGQRRGTSTYGLPPSAFVNFTQNHDQVANSAKGLRCAAISDPGTFRAITALTLLGSGTPMLFQGQEFAASAPFYYFADHVPDLAKLVRDGRIEFMSQFDTAATIEMKGCLPDPSLRSTFERSKLDWSEVDSHREAYALHCDLLALRRNEPVFCSQRPLGMDGAVLSERGFVLRFFDGGANDRLLLVNLGSDLNLDPAPEPLLAPPDDTRWATLWSSENPKYGGCGTPPLDSERNWRIPGRSAVVLHPEPLPAETNAEEVNEV